MKVKKILYVSSGIITSVVAGMGLFLGLIMLLFNKLIEEMFSSSYEIVEEFIEELSSEDASFAYLKDFSQAEAIDFVMNIVLIMSLIIIVIALIWLTFGILNFLLGNRGEGVFLSKPALRHVFVALAWIFMIVNPANILTTIAVYKKDKTDTQEKLYVSEKE